MPVLRRLIEIGTSFDTDGTKRSTVDFDRVVGDATALRINVVGYDGGVADRDSVNFDPCYLQSRRNSSSKMKGNVGGAVEHLIAP